MKERIDPVREDVSLVQPSVRLVVIRRSDKGNIMSPKEKVLDVLLESDNVYTPMSIIQTRIVDGVYTYILKADGETREFDSYTDASDYPRDKKRKFLADNILKVLRYDDLLEEKRKLDALRAYGVDNWEGLEGSFSCSKNCRTGNRTVSDRSYHLSSSECNEASCNQEG
jgi:hypothetical protein